MTSECGVCGAPAGDNPACSTCLYTRTVLTAWEQRRPAVGVLGQGVRVVGEAPPKRRAWWRFWERR